MYRADELTMLLLGYPWRCHFGTTLWLISRVQCKLYLLSFWAQILFNLNVLDIGLYKMACDPAVASTFVSVLGL